MELIPNMYTTKNYSTTVLHVRRVAEMADRLGISQGEVIRRAVDLLYEKVNDGTANASANPTRETAEISA